MLDFSFAEIALIAAVAVVFLRPEDVPAVVRAISRAMSQLRKLGQELRSAFDELAQEAGAEEITREVKQISAKTVIGDDGKPHEAYNIEDFLKRDDQ